MIWLRYSNGLRLLFTLSKLGSSDFDVVPGDSDGVVIVAYQAAMSAEIHCLSDGSYELLHEVDGGTEEFNENLSVAALISTLEGYGWKSPRFFASCTQNVMFPKSNDTAELLSEILPVVVFPLFVPPVSQRGARSHAFTSASSIGRKSVENRQSSGEYRSLPCQKVLA